MDLTCFNWIQLVKKSDLPANAKYLALYLGTFMNAEHDIAWPSMIRICHETGLTKNTARKWLDYLHDQHWLIKKKNARHVMTTGGPQMQNEYLVNIPKGVIKLSTGGVNDSPTSDKGGSMVDQRGVNHSSKGGQQLPPNNNRITSNNKRGKTTRGARLSLDGLPKEWEEFAKTEKPNIDPCKTFEVFKDHWAAQPGQKGVKLDWFATWRNWVRRERAEPLKLPADDNDLWKFAKDNGLQDPGRRDTNYQYRRKLEDEIRRR
jgi:hypothetical protein